MKYSLRSLMIVVTLICVATGVLAYPVRAFWMLREADRLELVARNHALVATSGGICVNEEERAKLLEWANWCEETASNYRRVAWCPWLNPTQSP